MRIFTIVLVGIVFLTGCTESGQKAPYSETKTIQNHEAYVGAESCKECHEEAFTDWKKSDHFYAMQKATSEYVKGDFNTTYSADEIQYRFYKKDTTYFVEITEAGTTQNFEVSYTFGWHPLQQYLLKAERGKFQTLRASWDTEKNKWFHQQQGTIVEPHDWLSWSKGGQNWNTMCSSCHSTHLKKNYDEVNDSFNTTFEEINVACESCHGPGGKHLDFRINGTGKDSYTDELLTDKKAQIDNCGTCHARRTMLADVNDPQNNFLHNFIPQNLTTSFYEGDGQIKEEDFVYGSFLSSRMYRNHVACNNCHNPHSGEIKMQGNALCLQCHDANYNSDSHHHHQGKESGTDCISCHMDGKFYMGNDYRKDHSFRIPRPDQSVQYGTTNACNSCHKNKNVKWAANAVTKWYGTERTYHFSDDLLPASLLDEQSIYHLENLLANDSVPTIIQSTALEYLQYINSPEAFNLVLKSLTNKEPLVRQSGYVTLLSYPNELRIEPGLKGLSDPVKAVRLMAFRTVRMVNAHELKPENSTIRNNVNAEYLAYLKTNSDFPTGQALIGEYYQQQGDYTRATVAFERSLKMDSIQMSPYSNLAILYSQKNELQKVKALIIAGIKHFPESAELIYFMGLNEGALGDEVSQLNYLKKAYTLQPENSKYSYNFILMLYNSGREREAKNELANAMESNPNNQRLEELRVYFERE